MQYKWAAWLYDVMLYYSIFSLVFIRVINYLLVKCPAALFHHILFEVFPVFPLYFNLHIGGKWPILVQLKLVEEVCLPAFELYGQ